MTTAPDLHHAKAKIDGVRLHYAETGSGPTVLLVHGWPHSWREWRQVIDGLSGRYRVVAVDLPGFGDSDRPVPGLGPIATADLLAAFLNDLGAAPAHLVGHDLGGLVAYTLTRRHPETVTTLTLADTPLPLLGLPHPEWAAIADRLWYLRFHQVPDLPEALITGRERLYLQWFFSQHSNDPTAISPDDVDHYVSAYSAPGGLRAGFDFGRALPRDAEQLAKTDAAPITTPTLLLGGAHSMRDAMAPAARTAIPDLAVDTVPDSGHWIPDENPAWLLTRLQQHWATKNRPAHE